MIPEQLVTDEPGCGQQARSRACIADSFRSCRNRCRETPTLQASSHLKLSYSNSRETSSRLRTRNFEVCTLGPNLEYYASLTTRIGEG